MAWVDCRGEQNCDTQKELCCLDAFDAAQRAMKFLLSFVMIFCLCSYLEAQIIDFQVANISGLSLYSLGTSSIVIEGFADGSYATGPGSSGLSGSFRTNKPGYVQATANLTPELPRLALLKCQSFRVFASIGNPPVDSRNIQRQWDSDSWRPLSWLGDPPHTITLSSSNINLFGFAVDAHSASASGNVRIDFFGKNPLSGPFVPPPDYDDGEDVPGPMSPNCSRCVGITYGMGDNSDNAWVNNFVNLELNGQPETCVFKHDWRAGADPSIQLSDLFDFGVHTGGVGIGGAIPDGLGVHSEMLLWRATHWGSDG